MNETRQKAVVNIIYTLLRIQYSTILIGEFIPQAYLNRILLTAYLKYHFSTAWPNISALLSEGNFANHVEIQLRQ